MDDDTKAARDVLAERRRQDEAEGWSADHDDEHRDFELEAAEIARRFAMFNNRHENGGEYSDGVEETCDAVSAMIEAKAGEKP